MPTNGPPPSGSRPTQTPPPPPRASSGIARKGQASVQLNATSHPPTLLKTFESSLVGRTCRFVDGDMYFCGSGGEIYTGDYIQWDFEIVAAFVYEDGVCCSLLALSHKPGKVLDGVPLNTLLVQGPKYIIKLDHYLKPEEHAETREAAKAIAEFLNAEIEVFAGGEMIVVCGAARLLKFEDAIEALKAVKEGERD